MNAADISNHQFTVALFDMILALLFSPLQVKSAGLVNIVLFYKSLHLPFCKTGRFSILSGTIPVIVFLRYKSKRT